MAAHRQQFADHRAHLRVVVDEQDAQLLAQRGRWRRVGRLRRVGRDETEGDRGASVLDAIDRELAAVAPDDAVGHAQAEARAGEALGREEGLHRALLDTGRHAGAGVHHGTEDRLVFRPGGDRDLSAVGQRLDRVEDEVHEDFAQRRGITSGGRDIPGLQPHVDLDPADLGFGLPAWPRHLDDFFGQFVEVHRDPFRHGLSPAEHAHAANDFARVEHAALGDLQIARDLVLVLGAPERDLHAPEHDGQEVVQVMRDTGGQLADRAQPLGLDDAAMGALELLVHGDQLAAAPPVGLGQQRREAAGRVHQQEVEGGHAPVGRLGARDGRKPADVLDHHHGQVGQRGRHRRDDAGQAREHEPGVERDERVHAEIRRRAQAAGAVETERQQADVAQHPEIGEHAARASGSEDEIPGHVHQQAGEGGQSDDRADGHPEADRQDLREYQDYDRDARPNSELLHQESLVTLGPGEWMVVVGRGALSQRGVRGHDGEVIGRGGHGPEGLGKSMHTANFGMNRDYGVAHG